MSVEQHAEAAANEIDRSMTEGPVTIIARHMQAAINEATAPLRARIEKLEGLGPLIDQLERAYVALAANGTSSIESAQMWQEWAIGRRAKIDAILKGGAP